MAKAMLLDFNLCIGCRACQVACKEWNQNEGEVTENTGTFENPPDLSSKTWTKIKFIETGKNPDNQWFFRRMICQHCTNAACQNVCPPKAISHMETTAVVIDQDKCTGCKYCISACPFSIPRYDAGSNTAKKCTLCIDRISNGLIPACAKVCAPGAVRFGEREVMLRAGQNRVEALKKEGHANAMLYGETALGGLGVMTVMTEAPDVYGLPTDPAIPLSVGLWQDWLKPLTIIAGVGGLAAAVISRIGSIGYKHGEDE
ncbi:MAG: 4Fe-4S dicluster domain-containing protein [Actinomycetota bacterium]